MIVNGKRVAEEIYASLSKRRDAIARPISLGIIAVGTNAVIESFIGIKERVAREIGVTVVRKNLPSTAPTEEAISAVRELSSTCDGIIVQLPLAKHMDVDAILRSIPKHLDVDAINPDISDDERFVRAPVALAVEEILARGGVNPKNKRAVVVGTGRLVGKPTAALLKRRGAIVSTVTLQKGSLEDLQDADIVVLGAGNPGFVKPSQIRDGTVLIDAGASESEGRVVGDADPACAEKAALFTPVPGGIGPIAVAMIFKNLFNLVEMRHAHSART